MKRTDIHTILVPGSGAIVIGQAAEFDYSGTQAVKALKAEGYRVVLVNSNPATIMTDPEIADATYIEPLTPEALEAIIAQEKPDAMLPTVGGQTGLNLALALSENGVLEKYGVQLIGAKLSAIKAAEDRLLFRETMRRSGIPVPRGGAAYSLDEAEALVKETGYPVLVRAVQRHQPGLLTQFDGNENCAIIADGERGCGRCLHLTSPMVRVCKPKPIGCTPIAPWNLRSITHSRGDRRS